MKVTRVLLGFFTMMLFSSFLNPTTPSETSIRAIVFDFGGVVGTSNREFVRKAVAEAFHISPQEVPLILDRLKRYLMQGGDETVFWESVAHSFERKMPDNWLTEFRFILAASMCEIPGSLEIVKRLRRQGFQVALLTNVRKDKAEVLKKLGYYEYFHPTVLSCDVNCVKPDPKIYKILLDKLGVSPEECLFIDDKRENVEAAQAMGLDVICFFSAEQLTLELQKRGIFLPSR